MGDPYDIERLAADVRAGDPRSLARLLSRIEDEDPATRPVVAALFRAGSGGVVGVTGPPGAGKSTLVDGLVARARAAERGPVAVLAVDPSSPFTGGAILGDRVRMQRHAGDRGVFIRSMATRGSLGGLAAATPKAAAVLSGLGFAEVLVETVGVGQAEVDIAATATTTVVVLPPAFGDSVQAAKAGLLEVGDVFVVNQADRPGADEGVRRLLEMLELSAHRAWVPPVLTTVATTGEGVDAVWEAVAAHRGYLASQGGVEQTHTARALVRTALGAEVARRVDALLDGEPGSDLIAAVAARTTDPWSAAAELAATSG